jgi:hypothetical protein
MDTPEELRTQAESTETLARLVSFGRDKEHLMARGRALREQADRLESGSVAPTR